MQGELFLGTLLELLFPVVQVISEADDDQSEIILAWLFDVVEADAFFQNCLRNFTQGHVLRSEL